MLSVSYVGHSVLEDGTLLLGVLETTTERRWFRTRESSQTIVYVLKGGWWWGQNSERVPNGPLALRLAELAMQHVVIAPALDRAIAP